jgi:hypothetical protein
VTEGDRVRIEIAFDGGQIMGALVTPAAADELQRRLDSTEDGALELDASDGKYIVALRRIVYVKRFARESRVGFASAG